MLTFQDGLNFRKTAADGFVKVTLYQPKGLRN